ncbi:MAG: DUF3861 domain-containing protein [Candidatus Accumulibacter sp.]|nr:DUF3861 domain-containing protein [Accumulibacter sp.]
MKRKHRYRITVEHLASREEAPANLAAPLCFEAESHDEIIALARRVRQQGDFDPDSAAALVAGLKLLGEVMLQNREHPSFEAFFPHYVQLVKSLKERTAAGPPPDPGEAPRC